MPPITEITFADNDGDTSLAGFALLAAIAPPGPGVAEVTIAPSTCPAGTLILAHLDDVGGTVADYCGNATASMNVGALSADTLSAANPLYGAASFSTTGGADNDGLFSFGGVVFPTAQWCIEAWAEPGDQIGDGTVHAYQNIVVKADATNALDLTLFFDPTTAEWSLDLTLTDEAGGAIGAISLPFSNDPEYVVGAYNHVAVDYDGADYWLYLNGNPMGNITSAVAIGTASDAGAAPYLPLQFLIGNNNAAGGEAVYIDEVRISSVSRYPNGTPFVPAGPFPPP